VISVASQESKTVHLMPEATAVKRLLFDDETMNLRPNLVLVDRRGAVVFEINELGLKGAARDPLRKLAVVWGDSVVFGIGWSWPCLLDAFAPGYQFLNGGIVADPYDNILRRAAAFNQANAVALNIVMLGWHPMSYASPLARPRRGLSALLHRIHKELPNFRRKSPAAPQLEARISVPHISHQNQPLRAALLKFLETTPNTVLVTMPTPLNRNIVGQDLSPYFVRGNRRVRFNFLGDFPYLLELQQYAFDHITERNAIVREVAQASGTRLLDLYAVFDTERTDDFREHFHDMLHLRPSAYPKAARAVYEGIKDLL